MASTAGLLSGGVELPLARERWREGVTVPEHKISRTSLGSRQTHECDAAPGSIYA